MDCNPPAPVCNPSPIIGAGIFAPGGAPPSPAGRYVELPVGRGVIASLFLPFYRSAAKPSPHQPGSLRQQLEAIGLYLASDRDARRRDRGAVWAACRCAAISHATLDSGRQNEF